MNDLFDVLDAPAEIELAAAPQTLALRPYQAECVERTVKALEKHNTALYVLATGLGKTVIAAHLAKRFPTGKIMFVAHRQELIYQAQQRFESVLGIRPQIEMADQWADSDSSFASRIIIGTVQTLTGSRGGRRTRFKPSDFSLVIIDESHHACASTYLDTIGYFRQNPDCKIVGMTATPDRTDEEALGKVFDTVSFEYELPDAIDDGWLVPIVTRQIFVEDLDFSRVRTTAGDLNGADLEAVMMEEKILHGVADPLYQLAAGRQTLVFTASVAHANRLAEILNRHEPGCARWVCGETEKEVRAEILTAFANKEFRFLCNCAIATEGFDCPNIEVVAMARPTQSRALYAQMLGRGTRALPEIVDGPETPELRKLAIAQSDKAFLEVIDWVGNTGRHELVSAVDVLGGRYTKAVVKAAKELVKKEGCVISPEQALERAKARLEQEEKDRLEAAKRALIIGKATFTSNVNRPFATLGIEVKSRGWDKVASPEQLAFLEKAKFPQQEAEKLTMGQAGVMIGEIKRRYSHGLCSVKQAALLKRNGLSSEMTFAQAKATIDILAQNHWRWPQGVEVPTE